MSNINEVLIQKEETEKTSLISCSLLLANGAIGAGILTLSLAVSKIGWGFSLGMYLFFGVFAGLANGMLYTVQRYTRQDTYSGIVKKLYGRKMEIFVDIVQLLYSFGACVGYAIIIADELHICFSYMLQRHLSTTMYWIFSREFILIFMTIFVILPIALQKKITALKYTSFLAIAGIIYLTLVMIAQAVEIQPCDLAKTAHYICESSTCVIEPNIYSATCRNLDECIHDCQKGIWDEAKIMTHGFIFTRNLFMALPVFCYGHCSQVQFIPIVSDMEKPTKARVSLVIFIAYTLIFAVYCINSLTGYVSFCGYTTGNILNSYPSSNIPILIGRFIIAIALCFTFPLYGYNVREVVMKMCGWDMNTVPYWKLATVTVIYVLFSSFTALFLKSLYTVVAMTGSLGGSLIEAIIPAMLYMKYIQLIDHPFSTWHNIYASFFIVLGLIIAILGTWESIAE